MRSDPPRHYPYVMRMLLRLLAEGRLPEIDHVDVEPEFGFAARIVYTDGTSRTTFGNDLGLNTAAASAAVTDKHYAKHFLRAAGISVPDGQTFGPGITRPTTPTVYARDTLGLPVYVKPVKGMRGDGVWYCESVTDVEEACALLEGHVFLVEAPIDLPDHRIVVLDGRILTAFRRTPLTVIGDGTATLAELAEHDPRIDRRLRRLDLTWDTVPAAGERVRLHEIANLATGGAPTNLTHTIAPRWAELAIAATRLFGLRLCGVDLLCADLGSSDGDYAVLELNANPGFELSAPEVYADVFRARR